MIIFEDKRKSPLVSIKTMKAGSTFMYQGTPYLAIDGNVSGVLLPDSHDKLYTINLNSSWVSYFKLSGEVMVTPVHFKVQAVEEK